MCHHVAADVKHFKVHNRLATNSQVDCQLVTILIIQHRIVKEPLQLQQVRGENTPFTAIQGQDMPASIQPTRQTSSCTAIQAAGPVVTAAFRAMVKTS
jgi:hypothetical protein